MPSGAKSFCVEYRLLNAFLKERAEGKPWKDVDDYAKVWARQQESYREKAKARARAHCRPGDRHSLGDCLSFNPFPFDHNGVASLEVTIDWLSVIRQFEIDSGVIGCLLSSQATLRLAAAAMCSASASSSSAGSSEGATRNAKSPDLCP
jgi:hypothetical protein